MSATEHPEFREERHHLEQTLEFIDEQIKPFASLEFQAADQRAAQAARKVMLPQLDRYKDARKDPYFGRVDIADDDAGDEGQPCETMYIGKFPITERQVYGWKDTEAADLFYHRQSRKRPSVRLLLKRELQISNGALLDIRDTVVAKEISERLGRFAAEYADSLLLSILKDHRAAQLHDIVATIQERQFEIIRSPKDGVLIVQGGPGSGKTQVALHRLSYQLYQHQDDGQMRPRNCLVLGPSPLFMDYIGRILPSLGDREIPQSTFDGWLQGRLGEELQYERQDQSLERLLDPGVSTAQKVMDYRNGQNKGSLRMAQMLDRYVELVAAEVLPEKPLTVEWPPAGSRAGRGWSQAPLEVEIPAEEVRQAALAVRDLPLNRRRIEVENRLTSKLEREIRSRLNTLRAPDTATRDLTKEARGHARRYLQGWESQNVAVAYRRLMRSPDILRETGTELFSPWDLEMMTQDAPSALKPFRFHDLAPLLYLKLLLDGPGNVTYDHVVVDEAQDLSPLAFKVLAAHCRVPSMTVLGDLAQGIYIQHAAPSWEKLIGNGTLNPQSIAEVYRSTQQIVRYANAVLSKIALTEQEALPQPIGRDGPEPAGHGFESVQELAAWLAGELASQTADGPRSIAVLCKTVAGCRQLDERLRAAGFTQYTLLADARDRYSGGVVLAPVFLAKGLEFDAVIVADADAQTYPADDLHARMLYVALSRAAHDLHVAWAGAPTLLLPEAAPVALDPFLPEARTWSPVTIAEYIRGRAADTTAPALFADDCVERLAATEKLGLLQDGRIDGKLLDLLLGLNGRSARIAEEQTVRPLEPLLLERVAEESRRLETATDGNERRATALAQLVFGLFRLQLRAGGLPVADEGETPLSEQLSLLLALLRAVEEEGFALTSGRWTTRQRTLAGVRRESLAEAERCLELLLGYGCVETNPKDWRIRLSPDWMAPVLRLGLGHPADELDRDLLQQLPQLPLSLQWEAAVEQEVAHD